MAQPKRRAPARARATRPAKKDGAPEAVAPRGPAGRHAQGRVDLPRRRGAAGVETDGPHFLGHIVNHLVLDPRDRKTLLAAPRPATSGRRFRSTDRGKTWKEATRPPAFPKAPEGTEGRTVDHTFWLTPGHASEPGVWYAGTSPQGLFRSEDGGDTWEPLAGFNDDPQLPGVDGHGAGRHARRPEAALDHRRSARPDAPLLRPCRRRRARVARRRRDLGAAHRGHGGGRGLRPGQRHRSTIRTACACARRNPDRLYQQNHCGIYRIDRPSNEWMRIGKNMPKQVGDIGFPMVVHPRDADTRVGLPDGRHRRSGRARARTASPRSTCTRDGGQDAGSGSTAGCRERRPGGR